MSKAVVISTGSELVEGRIVNTNAKYICEKLTERGFVIKKVLSVDDDLELICSIVKEELKENDLLIITGGLGPTEDDKTREAVAKALDRSLYTDENIAQAIIERVKRYYPKLPGSITKQAQIIEGARIIPNKVGTAPGQLIVLEDKKLVILPGPPQELIPMFTMILPDLLPKERLFSIVISFFGIPESVIDDKISQLKPDERIKVATQASYESGVKVRLIAEETLQEKVEDFSKKLVNELQNGFVGYGDVKLEELLVQLLRSLGKKFAVAESCTGGMVASRIVSVPGASEVFLGGVVAYDNRLKTDLLGVSSETIIKYGAVSAECAVEMALGVRKITGADISVAITGIAGPTGGSPEKPVGTVYIATSDDKEEKVEKFFYPHERNVFRSRISAQAIYEIVKKLRNMI